MLALRNPLDTTPTQTTGVRTAGLFGQPAPAPAAKSPVGQRARAVQARPGTTSTSPRAAALHGPGDQGRQANRGNSPMSIPMMSRVRQIGRAGQPAARACS